MPGSKHDIGATRHLGSFDDYRVASNGLKAVEYPEGKEEMDDISRKLYKSATPRSGQTTDHREVQAAPKSQSNGNASLAEAQPWLAEYDDTKSPSVTMWQQNGSQGTNGNSIWTQWQTGYVGGAAIPQQPPQSKAGTHQQGRSRLGAQTFPS
ncbi:hypothetical protein LTS12_027720, partial [Elasticomyces elasticus]